MGVDYMIGYSCVPKELFTSDGLLERVKAGERAAMIREFYRQQGEERLPQNMGFEMIYRTSAGEQETKLLRVDELEKLRAELDPVEQHCVGCPANRLGRPFGCIGSVNYPISVLAETWLLAQLPHEHEPLPFLLLTQGRDMGNTGERAAGLRERSPGVFFESLTPLVRRYPEMEVTGEQLFELMFLLGRIQPKRAVLILLFMGAIRRDMDADELMRMNPAAPDAAEKYPFLLRHEASDDASIRSLKDFLHALYVGFLLDRDVLLDV